METPLYMGSEDRMVCRRGEIALKNKKNNLNRSKMIFLTHILFFWMKNTMIRSDVGSFQNMRYFVTS